MKENMEYKAKKIDMQLSSSEKPFSMNLQFFNDSDQGDEGVGSDEGKRQGGDDSVTLTKDELEKEKQREADRKVQEALKNQEQKLQKQFDEQLDQRLKEREELAKLSEQERAEKEAEVARKAFEEEKAQFYRDRLKLQAEQDLLERELPKEFAPYVLDENAEKTLEVIKGIEEVWKKKMEEVVNKKLGGNKPSLGNNGGGDQKHSYAEQRNKADVNKNNAPNPWAI